MRTTVEIDDAQRAELLKLAAQRGDKGFSAIVREALDAYLAQQRSRRDAIAKALEARGSLKDAEADALEASVRDLRAKWR